ncbi:MAG: Xaa-Pro peptidase family protein [Actinomycetota bacterium]|nr:Xaa-Pro peptidase family protein [Actinomycetota bacterium]
MRDRIARLRAQLEPLEAGSFLVTHPVNIRYLTGFESSNAALVVRRDSVLLATDGRYVDAARAVAGVEVVEAERELAPFVGPRLGELAEPPVAFEATHVTYAAWEALGSGGTELRPARGVLERLRSVKDDEELAAIRRAAARADAVYERLAGESLVGRSETDVAWSLVAALHDAGADEPSFPPIVAAGPSAARPHHHPGARTIGRGETVIVDLGARLDGYCSDCTRTFVTDGLPGDLARAYETCREAQAAALEAVRPGASAREVDAVARTAIADAGYEVLHGLGYGVGLEVHELPRLAHTSDATLAVGNVVTVEPGVYLPGRGGVRIEDLVIVTDDGAEILTRFSKDRVVFA